MEVYGDDYHVAPAHPGLSRMLDLRTLTVETGDEWHIQTVRSSGRHEARVTPIYEAWREKCLREWDGQLPEYGAIWFAYYPNVMIEVYPYTITVSTLHPISPTETMNVVEYYYHMDVSEELIQAEISAYRETALEDDDIAERMEAGRAILRDHATEWWHTGDELIWPAHEHLERGTEHFIEWYRERMVI
jgi:choline monooxygenase